MKHSARRYAAACLLALTVVASSAHADDSDSALSSIRPESIRATMRFLADDLLEGRGTGARGHEIAAHYLASQFEAMGLSAGGNNGTFFQDVPIRAARVDEAGSRAVLKQGSKELDLAFRKDILLSVDPGRQEADIDAPIVFAGFGISAPSQGYDDYKHLDVKGKIVAVLFGSPNFPSAVKAHYSASWLKRRTAAEHGAVGYLLIYDPRIEKMYSFQEVVRDIDIPKLRWLNPAGQPNDYNPELQVTGTVSMEGARKLLEGSKQNTDQIFAAARTGKPQGFLLAQRGHFHTATRWKDIKSPNVVAKLEGSDPSLKDQYVVYSAHLDHLGVSTPVDGDGIYNGALDNASGSAVLVEVARALAAMPAKPKRSFVFVAVTGEEAGLIGSDYYAANPTVPVDHIVANVNMDEDVMLWPLRDVLALGAEHSSLAGVVERAATKLGIASSPDPQPEQVAFIRSDQYSFVRQGIPAFSLAAGWKSDDPSIDPKAINEKWDDEIYHHPNDDMQQPRLDFEAGALYAKVALLCGIYAADEAGVPTWNKGDFFGAAFKRAR